MISTITRETGLIVGLLAAMALSGCSFLTPGSGLVPEREGDDAGECSDGADNDRDGDFDCDDEDCAGSPDCGAADTGAVDTGTQTTPGGTTGGTGTVES
jgi:hypothetical protein